MLSGFLANRIMHRSCEPAPTVAACVPSHIVSLGPFDHGKTEYVVCPRINVVGPHHLSGIIKPPDGATAERRNAISFIL